MHQLKKSVLILAVLSFAAAGIFAKGSADPVSVKVLEISLFEVGEYEGDFAGEFQHWYEKYFSGTDSYEIKGIPHPLFVNEEGVAGTVAGMGKAQAASTLTAILSDSRFDFSETYIVISGCSGATPDRATLGDVIIATQLVDYELGHGWTESDTPAGTEGTFLKDDSYTDSGFIPLNSNLVSWAFEQTIGVELTDDPKAADYRALYPQEAARALPSVKTGVSMTGDNYWHGPGSSARADEVCADYDADRYMVTQMEDNGFGVVAKRFDMLERLLVIRDVVNFDQPHPGQTVLESLDTSSGGFSIGMTNGFLVGSAIVDQILANWESMEDLTSVE